MNKFICMGNITKDLELKESQSGKSYLVFSVALNRGKDKDGNDMGADFINCKAFGKTAEAISRFFDKGRKILIEGKIQTGSYKNQEGRTVYTTDCLVERFYFVDSKPKNNSNDYDNDNIPEGFEVIDEDDLPF